MDETNRILQQAFKFKLSDLYANREGRLSNVQQARLKMGKSNGTLAMGMFIFVMLFVAAIIVFTMFQLPNGTPSAAESSATTLTIGIVVAVIFVVILIGYLTSRKYLNAMNIRQISVAKGKTSVASNIENNWQVKIGTTKLRVPAQWQLDAFHPGATYRVYYLAGPVVNIMSAETVAEDGSVMPISPAEAQELPVSEDEMLKVAKNGRTLIFVLGFLVVEITLVGLGITVFPVWARWFVALPLMLIEAIGFVYFALRWLGKDEAK